MASIRVRVQRDLASGTVSGADPLVRVRGIGPYLAARLADGLGVPAPLTLDDFWERTRPLSTARVQRLLERALQNARGNQCASPGTVARRHEETYHVGDINEFGYQACIALLDDQRARRAVRYGALPKRLPARPRGSRECGCRAPADCTGLCIRTDDGACVPRAHNARGFVGVRPHPDQVERATTDAARRSLRRRGHTRMSPALRRDPGAAADLAAGHSRTVRYARRGDRLWRRPSRKVRLPVR